MAGVMVQACVAQAAVNLLNFIGKPQRVEQEFYAQ